MNEHRMRREAVARGEPDPGPSAPRPTTRRLRRGKLRVEPHVADAYAWNLARNRAQRRGGR